MSNFFEDMMNDLTDAIAIEKGETEIQMVFASPAPTFIVSDSQESD